MTALPTYDADELASLLEAIAGADSVELKLTVPLVDQRPVLHALEIDSLDAEIRQLAYIDTRDLRLSEAGVVVRARRTQRRPGDVTVKLRPMRPADVPEQLRQLDGFKVEVDASPAGFTCSCSLTVAASDRKVKEVYSGSRALRSVLSDEQRRLLAGLLPEDVDLGDLQVLGPVHILKCKFSPKGFDRRLVAELWFLPDGSRILELSTKSRPEEAFLAAAETKVFLLRHGLDLGAPQDMKTRSALTALVASLETE
jgi:hypothetical protein